MARRETSQEIDDAAADWAARLDCGALTSQEQRELEAWSAADPRRAGALARALAILARFDDERMDAAGDHAAPAFTQRGRSWRLARRKLIGAGAMAAGLGVAGLFFARPLQRGEEFRTAKGELRTVLLKDGSRLQLNTASAVRVRYTGSRRSIVLLSGEALFDVAKDRTRPFVVHSDGLDVRAVGTSFSVSRLPGRPLEVLVREGLVDVGASGEHAPAATRLIPGCRAQATETGAVQVHHIGVAAVNRAMSWRKGMLDFDGVTLAEAADAFRRYSDQPIIIDDSATARRTVSGLFASNDPAGFAQAVAQSLNLKTKTDPDGIHLSR